MADAANADGEKKLSKKELNKLERQKKKEQMRSQASSFISRQACIIFFRCLYSRFRIQIKMLTRMLHKERRRMYRRETTEATDGFSQPRRKMSHLLI